MVNGNPSKKNKSTFNVKKLKEDNSKPVSQFDHPTFKYHTSGKSLNFPSSFSTACNER